MSASRGADRNPLAHPVRQPHHEDVPGRGRERDERPRDRRQEIPREHERAFAVRAIGDVAEHELEKARRRVGSPFDEAQENGRGAERRQKNGEQRKDHLRPDVGEEARESERDHGGGETTSRGMGGQAGPLSPPTGPCADIRGMISCERMRAAAIGARSSFRG